MKCKTCGKRAAGNNYNWCHCWIASQQCRNCHYLGTSTGQVII